MQARPVNQFINEQMEALDVVHSTRFQDSCRSVFLDYSAWIITKEYDTEASTQNEGTSIA